MKNFHIIEVKHLPCTNKLSDRVQLKSHRFESAVVLPFDENNSLTMEVAEAYLVKNGFNIIGKAEGRDCMLIITDTFETL